MKIAVALLTCDRYDYTVKTVESLLKHHPPGTLDLFHGDDASTDPRVFQYVESKGFRTVMKNDTRIGCSPSTDKLLRVVAEHIEPGTQVLYLQNDLECVRPLPKEQLGQLLNRSDASFVQLSYRTPRSRYARRIPWKSEDGESWKFGDTTHEVVYGGSNIGMGFQPSIAKIETWLPAVKDGKCERDYRSKTEYPDRQMARLTLPVFRHIGRRRTRNGFFGKGGKNGRRRSRVGSARYDSPSVMKRSAMQMGASVNKALCDVLKPGMKTLECGSGLTTYLFMALGCEHTALENDPKFASPWPCVQVCPLVGTPLWYDWQPDGPYDFVLVDGPRRRRAGLLRVVEKLADDKTIFLFDDTNRTRDRRLCDQVASTLGLKKIDVPSSGKWDYGKNATLLVPCK